MGDVFLYGTLRHDALRAAVLGRPATGVPARLPDHAVRRAEGADFPLIVAAPGAAAEGVLLRGLDGEEEARLRFYEEGFGYALAPVAVETRAGSCPASAFFAEPGAARPDGDWSLDDWAARWGGITVEAAGEVMLRRARGQTAAAVARLWPFILARAWSRRLAAEPAPRTVRSAAGAADVEIVRERPGYDGFFRLRAFDMRHRQFDGARTETFGRECFVAFDAALCLPYDPVRDCVLLIEQLRFGPIVRGDPAVRVLEPVAGLIDAGESPEEAARRETVEEAHLVLDRLVPIARSYASPGYTTEFFHCFLGLVDLSGAGGRLTGHPDEHEDIRTHVLPLDDALELVETGEVNVMPLAMMLLWLARHRARFRRAA